MGMGFIDREGNRYGEHYYHSDDYDGEVRCEYCKGYSPEDDMLGNWKGYWHEDCAKEAYTDVLGQAFITEYDLVDDYNNERKISLKELCFEDMDAWIEFLNRSNDKNKLMKCTKGAA